MHFSLRFALSMHSLAVFTVLDYSMVRLEGLEPPLDTLEECDIIHYATDADTLLSFPTSFTLV